MLRHLIYLALGLALIGSLSLRAGECHSHNGLAYHCHN